MKNIFGLKKFHSDFLIYVGGGFLYKAIPFLLIPILTKLMSTPDYGIMSIVLNYIVFLQLFANNGLVMSAKRQHYLDGPQQDATLLSSLLVSPWIAIIPIAILLYTVNFAFPELLGIDGSFFPLLLMGFVALCYFSIAGTFTKVFKKPILFLTLKFVAFISEFLLTLWFVSRLDLSAYGRIIAFIIANVFISGIVLFYLFRLHKLSFSPKLGVIKQLFKESAYLIPVLVLPLMYRLLDRYLVATWFSMEKLGLLSVALQVAGILLVFENSSMNAFQPEMFSIIAKKDKANKKKKLVKMIIRQGLLITLFAGALYLMAPLIYRWFIDPKFVEGQQYVLLIIIAYTFLGYFKLLTSIFISKKKYLFMNISVFIALIIFLGTAYMLKYEYLEFSILYGALFSSIYLFVTFLGALIWSRRADIKYFFSK